MGGFSSGAAGGGAGAAEIIAALKIPPTSSHSDDQEFNAALSGNTALTVSGNATWTIDTDRQRLGAAFDGQTAEDMAAQIWALTPTSAPVSLEAKFHMWGSEEAGAGPMVGIGFADGVTATDSRVAAYVYEDASLHNYSITDGTFTAHTTSLADNDMRVRQDIYLRLVWTAANTWAIRGSTDGINWVDFGTTTVSSTLTPTHYFVFVSSWGTINDHTAEFEYIRVLESDIS